MSFLPNVGDKLTISGVTYTIGEHPYAPGMPYGQEGRAATVYTLAAGEDRRALKVFKQKYRLPWLVGVADEIKRFATMPGLLVCERQVLTASRSRELIREHSDLNYSVLMPWVQGPTWMEVMLEKRELSPEESLMLGGAFAGILALMEERRLAHCDLSAPNVLIPGLVADFDKNSGMQPVELVDVEGMYGPGLDKPEILTTSSAGYAAHHTVARGVWEPKADRFAGAILLSEMLAWCDERVRKASYEENYFEQAEIQEDSERYRILFTVLEERWGEGTAALLERAWASDSLGDCPTFGDWLARLPHEVPAFTLRSVSMPDGTTPRVRAVPAADTESGPGAALDSSFGPTHAARSMMAAARQFEEKGDRVSALTSYRLALNLAPAGGALARELSFIVADLESGGAQKPESKPVSSLKPIVLPAIQEPEAAPSAPVSNEDQDALDSLFYGGLAAFKGKRWAEAKELLSEVVRQQPGYQRDGQQASKMLDVARVQLSANSPIGRVHVDTPILPAVTAATSAKSKAVLSYETTETSGTEPVTVQKARAPRQLRFIVPVILGALLLIFGAIAVIMAQGGSNGHTLAVVPTIPRATDTAVVAKVDEKATQLAAGTATSVSRIDATSTEAIALAIKTTEAAAGLVQATQESSTAEAQAQIVQATGTADAQLQAQGTATAQELQSQAQQAQSEATSLVLQAQATANAAIIVEQQATARALGGLQAQATALVLHATVTAQAEEIATSKAIGRANSQATTQAQNASRQATAQAQAQATNQAKTQSIALATSQVQAQQTVQAQQAVQATVQAAAKQATAQAQQAAAQQATVQAQQAAVQQATAQAQQAAAQQATTQAKQVATTQAEAAGAATQAAAQAAQATSVANETATAVALALSAPRTLAGHTEGVTSVAFSPDGAILASAGLDHTIKLWRVSDGANIRTLTGHTEWVEGLAFSPDGQMLASSSYDKTIRLWKVSDGAAIRTLTGHDGTVNSIAFSPDGQILVSGSDDTTLKLWKVSDGTVIRTLTGHTSLVHSVAFSPDGLLVASGSNDDTIKLWKVSGGAVLHTLTGHSEWVRTVLFSADGQYLVSSSNDLTVKLWRVADGLDMRTFSGHTDGVDSVAISPDGQMIASGSHDKTIKLWRVSDGSVLHTLTGHSATIHGVAFSPDGRTLASASFDKTIKLWKLK